MNRNVALLSLAWSCATLINLLMVSVSALTGYMLAEDKSLAALPILFQWLGVAVTTIPASLLMQKIGRRAGFMISGVIVISGGGLAMLAIQSGSFVLFCAATAIVGVGIGFNWYLRFAAAEVTDEAHKSRAISLVLAGGIVAALAGPTLAVWSRDLLAPILFMGTFGLVMAFGALMIAIVFFTEIPLPPRQSLTGGRPMRDIAAQPAYRVAVVGGIVSYGVMVLMMSVTPLAMEISGFAFEDAAFVIQWHVLGMYVPSFFTGHLIRRFGALAMMQTGGILLLVAAAIAAAGIFLVHYWAALVLLGLGWNFLFTASTTLLTETYTTAERAKAQGVNEMLMFGVTGLGVFLSGALLHDVGWAAVALAAMPPVLLATVLAFWLGRRRARTVPAGS